MDQNTYLLITLLVVELATLVSTIATALLTFLKNDNNKLKRSSCCGGAIEYNNEDPPKEETDNTPLEVQKRHSIR